MYKCLHRTAPPYLDEEFLQSSDVETRQRLYFASSSSLVVRRTRLLGIGDRAFPVAVSWLWNTLLQNVTSAPSLPVLGNTRRLISSVVLAPNPLSCPRSDRCFGHYNRYFYLLTCLLAYICGHICWICRWSKTGSSCLWCLIDCCSGCSLLCRWSALSASSFRRRCFMTSENPSSLSTDWHQNSRWRHGHLLQASANVKQGRQQNQLWYDGSHYGVGWNKW